MRRTTLSRSGTTSPFGKLDARLVLKIDSQSKDRLAQVAAESGKPDAEFIRSVLRIAVWGPEHVKKVQDRDFERVAGMVQGKVP